MLDSQVATPAYRLGQQRPPSLARSVRMLWLIRIDCFGLLALASIHGALYDATVREVRLEGTVLD